jgi:hypothetical protein
MWLHHSGSPAKVSVPRLIVERIKRLIFQKGNKSSELKESAIDMG